MRFFKTNFSFLNLFSDLLEKSKFKFFDENNYFTWGNSLSTSSKDSFVNVYRSIWVKPNDNNRPITVSFGGLFHP